MFNEDWYSNNQCIELSMLVKQVNHLHGSIIEIGCWEGKSTIHIANACYPDYVICNDTWLGNMDESNVTGEQHISVQIAKTRDVFRNFIYNMDTLTKKNYIVKKMDCHDFILSVNEPIKFIHIDASHDYQSVYNVIRCAIPWMVKGGIMCGDDFLSANATRADLQGGVERAVRELLPGVKNIGNLWHITV